MASDASFNRLLRLSKVMHLDPQAPVAVTSYAGYLHRGDFGLKRPLPLAAVGKTPYVKVRSLDGVTADNKAGGNGTTNFIGSARESLFARRWSESGLVAECPAGATVNDMDMYLEASMFDTDSWRKVLPTIDGVPQEGSTQKSKASVSKTPTERSTGHLVDFTNLSDVEFERYLENLRDLQPAFQKFAQAQDADNKGERDMKAKPADQPDKAENPSEDSEAAGAKAIASALSNQSLHIVPFLKTAEAQAAFREARSSTPEDTDLASFQELTRNAARDAAHPVSALNYVPASAFDTAYRTRPIPVRLLSKQPAARNSVYGSGNLVGSALGLSVTGTDKSNAGVGLTQFEPAFGNDARIPEAGRTIAKVTRAPIAASEEQQADGGENITADVWPFTSLIDSWNEIKDDIRASGMARVPSIEVNRNNALQAQRKPMPLFGSRDYIAPTTEAEVLQEERDANVKKALAQARQSSSDHIGPDQKINSLIQKQKSKTWTNFKPSSTGRYRRGSVR